MDAFAETTSLVNTTTNNDDNWSDSLANLEMLLAEATHGLPLNEMEATAKAKSNPLLEQLLDKPINSASVEKETDDDKNGDKSELSESSISNELNDLDSASDSKDSESDEDEECGEERLNAEKAEENKVDVTASEELPAQDSIKRINGKTPEKGAKKKQRKVMKSLLRKNIKKIFTEKELDSGTIAARREEEERMKRIQERSSQLLLLQKQRQKQQQITITSSGYTEEVCLLSSDEESNAPNKRLKTAAEVIEISDEEEDVKRSFPYSCYANQSYKTSYTVPPLTEPEDDTHPLIDEDDSDEDDLDLYGTHTNDELNISDEFGRVLINVNCDEDEKPIYLAPQLAKHVKPHQIGGIRFLYDNIIFKQKEFQQSSGFGCILAHSMGLGKTMQLISFIDVFLTYTPAKRVLCIVPINTLQNWLAEFDLWLPKKKESNGDLHDENDTNIKYRAFTVYEMSDCKTTTSRAKEIISWFQNGGVLLLGYEMYRILTSNHISAKRRGKRKDEQEELDPQEYNKIVTEMKNALINPGPDLVVCDEGHRIKNCLAATSQSLKNIRTKRRIVLTGYPLQNNLLEYWCMVDFVRPSFLGTKQEFQNMFERPILNGQCVDSKLRDIKLMKYRSHVLYNELKGFVQRRSHSILMKTLPVKHEHVLLVRMTPVQKTLILAFLDTVKRDPLSNTLKMNPIQLFAVCCKIWNHPDVLYKTINEGKNVVDWDDLDYPSKNKKLRKNTRKDSPPHTAVDVETCSIPTHAVGMYPSTSETNQGQRAIDYEWAKIYMANYRPGIIEHGMKMVVLFEIIKQTLLLKDRILVFSQSLSTLDIIEKFLENMEVPHPNNESEKWCRNVNYYRLDGSTNSQEREKLINQFNKNENIYMFLLSTRAGCLGINLVGANRIVVFDASWNPCHDAQAACRIYRYGQQKECYIYRLICDNSLEKKVYDRQVSKQGMSHRVVDELNPDTNFTWREINSLIDDLDQINENPAKPIDPSSYNDQIVRHICKKFYHCITKDPFEHESLLLDNKEQKLSKREKKLAKENYEIEKKARNQVNHGLSPVNSYPRGYVSTGRGGICVARSNDYYPQTSQFPQYNSLYRHTLPTQATPLPSNIYNNFTLNDSNSYNQDLTLEEMKNHSMKRIVVGKDQVINLGAGQDRIFLKKGQEVGIIKTSSGLFLRSPEGRIVSLSLNPSDISALCSQKQPSFYESLLRSHQTSTVTLRCPTTSKLTHTPEVIDLSDDDDDSANNAT